MTRHLRIPESYLELTDNLLDRDKGLYAKLFKLISLIIRYHAEVYAKDYKEQEKKFKELPETMLNRLKDFDFKGFKPHTDPKCDFELA